MVNHFKGKKILIMGLGLHGGALALLKWLLKKKAILTVTDLKTKRQLQASLAKVSKLAGAKNIKYSLGGHQLKDFKNQDLIVQNPGVPDKSIYLTEAKKNSIPIVNEAVMFFGLYNGQSIGVTGTRGKSTTATLIHQLLKTEIKSNVVAGNIATNPMFAVIDKLKKDSLPVLELSSWHLEKMDEYKVSPHIALVTNVLNDHLNRYKNFFAYKRAKGIIVKHQSKSDIAILNADNPHSYSFRKHTQANVYFYSLRKKVKGAYVSHGHICFSKGKGEQIIMPISGVKLLGEHNLQNILGAIVVAKLVNIKNKNIARAVKNFSGIDYRLQYKTTIKGVAIYNDSTATNPDAVVAAIKALKDKKIVLIAGGEDKKMDYKTLAKEIKSQVKLLVLLSGTGSAKLLLELKKINCPDKLIIKNVPSLKKAWELSWKNIRDNNCLLLSPGAASFNMFINEFDRARQFNQLINDSQKKKK